MGDTVISCVSVCVRAGVCARMTLICMCIGRVWYVHYRIAGNFHGVQFSRFPRKLDPRNKYDCTVYNGHDRQHPRKLNREIFEDCMAIRENWTPRKFPAIRY
jgi:hypothetical protein